LTSLLKQAKPIAAHLRRRVVIPVYRWRLRNARKVIIGASGYSRAGWISTERDLLDVCDIRTFLRLWSHPQISHFLAEHVWEHLDDFCALEGIKNCKLFLLPAGRLRIAVPDGNHPDPEYIEKVRPGGSGPGCDDHKQLFTVNSLSDIVSKGGLYPRPLEWWDEKGLFHQEAFDIADGMVKRSADHDERNRTIPLSYTSLIIDALKMD
jgi:predicted SAM-dependent methyltransferase